MPASSPKPLRLKDLGLRVPSLLTSPNSCPVARVLYLGGNIQFQPMIMRESLRARGIGRFADSVSSGSKPSRDFLARAQSSLRDLESLDSNVA